VIVSNRVPPPRERASQAGGLAVAVRDALRRNGGLWFGWTGEVAEATAEAPTLMVAGRVSYATIDLGALDHRQYYLGYSNSTLWPLLHYRLGLLEFRREDLEGYLRVNEAMVRALVPLLRPDDLIRVHDYHLIPFGQMLRRHGVGNPIGFFLHTPFPVPQVLEALPRHEALLEALADFDLVGFQTVIDMRAFLACIADIAKGEVEPDGRFAAFGRTSRAGVFPVGIDAKGFAKMATSAARSPETLRLHESLVGRRLMIGVDRLDYSKGLPNRFAAYDRLLAARPEHRSKVTYLQVAARSRSDVAQYRALRRELEQAAGRTNGRFAEFDWMPLRYLTRALPRKTLAGFYRMSQVGLVTPLRDGMNLVAKEYVAAQPEADPGVLVLSRFAGAAQELDGALLVNPYDLDQMADAMHQALVMPPEERRARWMGMMAKLERATAQSWSREFQRALERQAAARAGGATGAAVLGARGAGAKASQS
jgi:trehalose 6-phosphate synthase